MRIAIKIIDTDFRTSYEGILRMIFDSWKQAKIQGFNKINYFSNKNQLKQLIGNLFRPAFFMYQESYFYCQLQYNEKNPLPIYIDNLNKKTEYLISKLQIFLNDEINDLEKGIDYIVLDTDLDYQNNNPIYFLE